MGRVEVAAIVSLWVITISILVNRIVPDPYMDEIFHIPQLQEYCKGNFKTWNPMITTPPGLYYLSLAHVASLFPGMFFVGGASSFSELCSTAILRSINGVLAVISSIIIYEIIIHLRTAIDEKRATLYAVVLALYPLHWFFTFLYYTDVASETSVLAMYLACIKKKYRLSASLGALTVLIRQTNIIWVLFVMCTGIIDVTLGCQKYNLRVDEVDTSIRKHSQSTNKDVSAGSLRRRKFDNAKGSMNHFTPSASALSTTQESGLLDEIQTIILRSWQLKWELLLSFSPYLIIFVAFIAFVCWNGSVVLGAKEAHAVSSHFAQVMYFGLVSALAMGPTHCNLHQASALFLSLWKTRPLSFFVGFICLLTGLLFIHFFSIAHPYLLADNRHYTFYLWRKVIKAHPLMKYLLVPLYIYSWFSISSILGKAQRKIWVLAYFLATAAVLVPAPLIEFRYFTTPFYFLILHSNIDNIRSWLLMGTLYMVINVFTMIMFLFRPFRWEHEAGSQRFIW